MVTKPRVILPNDYYHIYNRGAHKENIFKTEEDFAFFTKKLYF